MPEMVQDSFGYALYLAQSGKKDTYMNQITEGSGNVYADLGIPDAETMLVKAGLAAAISQSIASMKVTQQQAAGILGVTQSRLSNLLNGRFRGISEAKMMECLVRLGRDVRIVIGQERPRRKIPGKIKVMQES